MNPVFLISLILLYLIIAWFICFNALYDERFSVLDKKVIIGFLLIPPIGILLFIFLRTIRKQKERKHRIRKQKTRKQRVYHGGYDGGHNKPLK